jgi:hypothetical protein
MRSIRSSLVGFAAAGMMLAAGLVVAPQASAQSSSPGCFLPCDAAEFYLSSIGYFTDGFSNDVSRCRTQCGALRAGCSNAVGSSHRCVNGSFNSAFAIERQNCSDLEGEAANQCNANVSSGSSSLRSFVRDNVQCGRNTCESAFDECVSFCTLD